MNIQSFINRKEIPALIVAVVLLFLKPLAAQAGLPVPEAQLNLVVLAGFAFFGMTFAEGMFKPDYAAGWKTLWTSTKFRALLVSVGAVAVNAFLPPQYQLSEDTIAAALQFLVGLMGVKGGLDIWRVAK